MYVQSSQPFLWYYYDFHFNQNGMPQGCSNFENFTDAMPKGDTDDLKSILKNKHLGFNDCPKQKQLKHEGKPMSKIVDFLLKRTILQYGKTSFWMLISKWLQIRTKIWKHQTGNLCPTLVSFEIKEHYIFKREQVFQFCHFF